MSKADRIVAALGGVDNVVEVEGCITRLRTQVRDASLVDRASLAACGAIGVLVVGQAVQVVVGPEAEGLAEDIQELL